MKNHVYKVEYMGGGGKIYKQFFETLTFKGR